MNDGFGDVADDVFRVLRNCERRYALYYVLEHDAVSLRELVDAVAGWTRAGEPGMVSREERDAVHAAFVHRHLRLFEEASLLSWDQEGGTVSRTDWPSTVVELVGRSLDVEVGCRAT